MCIRDRSEALGLSPEEIAAAETATSATESIQRQTGEEEMCIRDSAHEACPCAKLTEE